MSFQKVMLEKLDIQIPKKFTWIHRSHTTRKIIQMDHRLNIIPKNIKLLQKNIGESICGLQWKYFLNTIQDQKNDPENKNWINFGPHQN